MENESWDPTLTDSPLSSKSSISSSVSSLGRTGAKKKRMQSAYYDEEQGVSRCRNCGWTYPDPRPDSRQRRDHKKVCEGTLKKAESGQRAADCTDRDRGSPSHLLRIQERDDVTGSGTQNNSDGSPGPHQLLGNSEMIALESEPFQIGSSQDPDLSTADGECDDVGAGSQPGYYGSLEARGDEEEAQGEEDRHTDVNIQSDHHDHFSPDDSYSESQELNPQNNSTGLRSSGIDAWVQTEETADIGRPSPTSGPLTGPIQFAQAHLVAISLLGILCFFGERYLSSR